MHIIAPPLPLHQSFLLEILQRLFISDLPIPIQPKDPYRATQLGDTIHCLRVRWCSNPQSSIFGECKLFTNRAPFLCDLIGRSRLVLLQCLQQHASVEESI